MLDVVLVVLVLAVVSLPIALGVLHFTRQGNEPSLLANYLGIRGTFGGLAAIYVLVFAALVVAVKYLA